MPSSNAQLARANAETEAARSNLANAIETVQEGFALFDPDDRLVMCNRRFGRHLKDIYQHFKPGLAYSDYVELVSRSPFLKLPEGTSPPQWAARRMFRHKDDHVVFNARMADRRWLQVSEHRTTDGGTVVLQTYVTNMIRLERQERDRLLDDQAQLIRATLEHLNQGGCIFDRENLLVGWNLRVGELLSIPVGRFHIGTSFDVLFEQLKREFAVLEEDVVRKIKSWISQRQRTAPLSFEFRTIGGLDISKLDSGKVAVNVSQVPLGLLMSQLEDEFFPIASENGFQRHPLYGGWDRSGGHSPSKRYRFPRGVRHRAGIPESQQERIGDEFHRLNATSSLADATKLLDEVDMVPARSSPTISLTTACWGLTL